MCALVCMFFFFVPRHAEPNAEAKESSDGFMQSTSLSYTETVTAGVSAKKPLGYTIHRLSRPLVRYIPTPNETDR
jgi:hypothetical protein